MADNDGPIASRTRSRPNYLIPTQASRAKITSRNAEAELQRNSGTNQRRNTGTANKRTTIRTGHPIRRSDVTGRPILHSRRRVTFDVEYNSQRARSPSVFVTPHSSPRPGPSSISANANIRSGTSIGANTNLVPPSTPQRNEESRFSPGLAEALGEEFTAALEAQRHFDAQREQSAQDARFAHQLLLAEYESSIPPLNPAPDFLFNITSSQSNRPVISSTPTNKPAAPQPPTSPREEDACIICFGPPCLPYKCNNCRQQIGCYNCILKWYKSKNAHCKSCPLCRQNWNNLMSNIAAS